MPDENEKQIKVRMDIELTESLAKFIQKRLSYRIGKLTEYMDGEYITITRIKPLKEEKQ